MLEAAAAFCRWPRGGAAVVAAVVEAPMAINADILFLEAS